MVQRDRVFELAYSGSTGRWRLVRRPEDFGPHQTATKQHVLEPKKGRPKRTALCSFLIRG